MERQKTRFQLDLDPATKKQIDDWTIEADTTTRRIFLDGVALFGTATEFMDEKGVLKIINPNNPKETINFTTPALAAIARKKQQQL